MPPPDDLEHLEAEVRRRLEEDVRRLEDDRRRIESDRAAALAGRRIGTTLELAQQHMDQITRDMQRQMERMSADLNQVTFRAIHQSIRIPERQIVVPALPPDPAPRRAPPRSLWERLEDSTPEAVAPAGKDAPKVAQETPKPQPEVIRTWYLWRPFAFALVVLIGLWAWLLLR